MAHALGVSRSDLLLRHMQDAAPDGFAALVERRAAHEPVAYILGRKEFYGREFVVTPGVLIPRMDSETTVAAALEALRRRRAGCSIAGSARARCCSRCWPNGRRPRASGIDRSAAGADDRLGQCRAARAWPAARGSMRRDWNEPGWADDLGRFDLILANPPYVEDDAPIAPAVRDWEPAGALFAGPDGLDDYRVAGPAVAGAADRRRRRGARDRRHAGRSKSLTSPPQSRLRRGAAPRPRRAAPRADGAAIRAWQIARQATTSRHRPAVGRRKPAPRR